MIEAVTPQVAAASVVSVVALASLLAALLSAVLLWRCRRSLRVLMGQIAGGEASSAFMGTAAQSNAPAVANSPDSDRQYQLALRAPWQDLGFHAVAVLALALGLSAAAQVVYPTGLGFPGYLVGIAIYSWPLLVAAMLILPGPLRVAVWALPGYALVYVALSVWAATRLNLPQLHMGALQVQARSGVTPVRMLVLWVSVNLLPTILCLLCFNRRVRAFAPLMLALSLITVGGLWSLWLFLSMPAGSALLARLESGLAADPALSALLLLTATALALLALAVWALRWLCHAYLQKRISDQILRQDAVLIVFLSVYGMWLTMGGVTWLLTVPAGFVLYRFVLSAARRWFLKPAKVPHTLCFLRVFALGARTEVLLTSIARRWRHIGSIQLIAGPDVAGEAVQPQEFLDFLAGRLGRHFVRDEASLQAQFAAQDHAPDPDGRFRINSLYCYSDTWQSALVPLTAGGARVLMDLRRFTRNNDGCLAELRFLAQRIPMEQVVLLVDKSTDRLLLEQTLAEALAVLPATAANHGLGAEAACVFDLEGARHTRERILVGVLCEQRHCERHQSAPG